MRPYMRRRVLKVALAIIVCWLLITLLSRSKLEQDEQNDNEIRVRFQQRKEDLKLRHLQDFQKVVFKNLSRPGENVSILS